MTHRFLCTIKNQTYYIKYVLRRSLHYLHVNSAFDETDLLLAVIHHMIHNFHMVQVLHKFVCHKPPVVHDTDLAVSTSVSL